MEIFNAIWAVISKSLLANLTGFQGFIGKYVLKYGGRALYDLLDKWVREHERAKEQKVAEEILVKVDANPKSTVDDIGKAYEDAINSGR